MKNNHFIVFEGGEGAGKTSLIDHVEEFFKNAGMAVVRTREPGGSPFGNQMRQWLLNHRDEMRIDAKAELLLFLSIRAQHIEELIIPALKAGKIVLCDRFNDSTIAYQGAGRGLGIDYVRKLCDLVSDKTLPSLVFYLDIDPKIGLERTKLSSKENAAAGHVDAIEAESLEFHQRVRNAFQLIAKTSPEKYCCLDASLSKESVKELALEHLRQLYHV